MAPGCSWQPCAVGPPPPPRSSVLTVSFRRSKLRLSRQWLFSTPHHCGMPASVPTSALEPTCPQHSRFTHLRSSPLSNRPPSLAIQGAAHIDCSVRACLPLSALPLLTYRSDMPATSACVHISLVSRMPLAFSVPLPPPLASSVITASSRHHLNSTGCTPAGAPSF